MMMGYIVHMRKGKTWYWAKARSITEAKEIARDFGAEEYRIECTNPRRRKRKQIVPVEDGEKILRELGLPI